MAKLTLKTTKEGQKCVLTTKTELYYDYRDYSLRPHMMIQPIPKDIVVAYYEYDTVYLDGIKPKIDDIVERAYRHGGKMITIIASDIKSNIIALENDNLSYISPVIFELKNYLIYSL